MRIYDKLYADEIVAVSIGRQAPPAAPVDETPATDVVVEDNAEAARNEHQARLDAIAKDADLSAQEKRTAVAKENKEYTATVERSPVLAPEGKPAATDAETARLTREHQDRLDTITKNDGLTVQQKQAAIDQENRDFGVSVASDGPEVVQLTTASGAKRTILRSELLLASTLRVSPRVGHPDAALRVASTLHGQGPALFGQIPRDPATAVNPRVNYPDLAIDPRAGYPNQAVDPRAGYPNQDPNQTVDPRYPNQATDDLYPQAGDFLVEDFDIRTDKLVQKVYDAVTFHRYFKASVY